MAGRRLGMKAIFDEAAEIAPGEERAAYLDRACGGDDELRREVQTLLRALGEAGNFLEVSPARESLRDDAIAFGSLSTDGPSDDPNAAPDREPERTLAEPGMTAAMFRAQDADQDETAAGTEFHPTPGRIAGHVPTTTPASPIGGVIAGRYKIREEIGEGGMGIVYLAEQTEPVRRQVALKLIKAGMDSRTVLARFESERQALALMDHPNIAKVYDAGTSEAGRPFFVMELVKGIPLTEYCDRNRLGLPERLALFRQICSAVQHAHQKGIIHRDLKPSNILVENHDDRPVPKVIDFGLAKATSGLQLTEHSVYSAFDTIAGTPLYMAPEQATFNALDVDTRADIYALGVILYEMLTGSTPIHRETMKRSAIDEMLRLVREFEPPTPSSRISSSEALPSLAATRRAEPARLSRFVRGDLDWIVMKALAKDRARRYDSAIGLAHDVKRFLNNEPVSAGPPTAAYRLRKFVRRNRIQVVTASLVLLALVLGVVGTTLGLFEARHQADWATKQEKIAVAEAAAKETARKAEFDQRRKVEKRSRQLAKLNEILGSIFNNLDPDAVGEDGKPLAALLGKRLDRATEEIEGEAIGDQLEVARIQYNLGKAQYALGYAEKSITLLEKARATFSAGLAPDHDDTLAAMNALAYSHSNLANYAQALRIREDALALLKAKYGPDHARTILSTIDVAASCRVSGRSDRAVSILEEALARAKVKRGPDDRMTLTLTSDLALAYGEVGRRDEAIEFEEQTLARRREKFGPDDEDTLKSMDDLASVCRSNGRRDRAIEILEEAVARRKAKNGPDHASTLLSMRYLALYYGETRRYDRAIALNEETLARRRLRFGGDHPETLADMRMLAEKYAAVGPRSRAIQLLEEVLALQTARNGPDSRYALKDRSILAQTLQKDGQFDRAEPLWDGVVAANRKTYGDGHPQTLSARLERANLDLFRGRLDAAEPALLAILAECRAKHETGNRLGGRTEVSLRYLYEKKGDWAAAVPFHRIAAERIRKAPANRTALASALTYLGHAELKAEQWPEAEADCREALTILEETSPDAWTTSNARSLLGAALLGERRIAEAEPLLRSGYEGLAKQAETLPPVGLPRLAEALDRLIALGEATGKADEVKAWKEARKRLAETKPNPESEKN